MSTSGGTGGGPPTGAAGGDLTGTYPNPTVGAGKVTLAKQAALAANSFQGNNTGSAATPIALTVAQARALLATLDVPTGGTGKTTLTAHGVLVGEGTSAVAVTSAGTAGQVLTSNGAAADPTFQAAGGGGSFPDFTGAGTPEGVQTAAVGKSYVDTTNGALYFKGSGAGNTGWVSAPGVTTLVPGFSVDPSTGNAVAIADAAASANALLSDDQAQLLAGTQNGIGWSTNGTDGQQLAFVQTGSSGQFFWQFKATGFTQLPGPLVTVPPDSHTATAAFSTLAVGTPLQSSLTYDVLVTGIIKITASTNGTLGLGVGSSATPTTDPLLLAFTTAAVSLVPYSAVVPAGYYLSIVSGGTITLDTVTAVATPL